MRIKLDDRRPGRRPANSANRCSTASRPSAFQEDIKFILLAPMAANGEEATGSMGNDSPLAVLSDKNKPLYNYFRQLFAQVTNPPIDPIREAVVMSLVSFVGPRPNLLDINAVNPPMRLEVAQPVLDFDDMARLRHIEKHTGGKFRRPRTRHLLSGSPGATKASKPAASLCAEAVEASRRQQHPDHHRSPRWIATISPSRRCWRCRRSTTTWSRRACAPRPVWSSKPARRAKCITSPCSPGYGAEAVTRTCAGNPGRTGQGAAGELSAEKAIKLHQGIGKGLSKIMSKMGISTYMSHCGAQIFEAIGLQKQGLSTNFRGTPSRSAASACSRWPRKASATTAAFGADPVLANMLDAGGEYAWRAARRRAHVDAGRHRQAAARRPAQQVRHLQGIRQIINDQSKRHLTLRGLFEFKVDPAGDSAGRGRTRADIVKRFATGAMSLGRSPPKRTPRWRWR